MGDSRRLAWQFPQQAPVISPGQLHGPLDSKRAAACQVIPLGDRYLMYYWGQGDQGNVILMAQSPVDRPNDWRPVGGPLLTARPDLPWVARGPSFPHVFEVSPGRWHMLLCGWGDPRPDGALPNTTGLAVSVDAGLTWEYHDANPVLACDQPFDQAGTGSVWVVKIDGGFRLYYTSISHYFARPAGVQTGHGDRIPLIGIGYAESQDGIHWHKPLDRLMVQPRGHGISPYEYIVAKPCVIREKQGYRMFVSTFGPAYRVRSLTSPDGLDWQFVESGPDGDLGIGPQGAFDHHQRSYACVVRHVDEHRMWYTGDGFGATGMGYCRAAALD